MSQFKADTLTTNVDMIINDVLNSNNGIKLDPHYQRGVVWPNNKMSHFIDSVLCGIVPNPLIFNRSENNEKICIDGKQRITSLMHFIKNKIPFVKNDENIYYSSLSIKTANCRVMTDKERGMFLSKSMPVIIYDNLSYTDQVDVFQRLQNGVKLTPGEIIVSVFEDEKLTKVFVKFCDDKEEIIKNVRNCIDSKSHRIILIDVMYMISKNTVRSLPRKEREKFLKSFNTHKKINEGCNLTNKLISECFTDDLFGHLTIKLININKNVFYTLLYMIYKKYIIKKKIIDYNKLRSVIRKVCRKWAIKNNSKMTLVTITNIKNSFNATHKRIFKKGEQITDDEDSSDEESSSDEDSDDDYSENEAEIDVASM
jgi:hypothetical protein